MSARPRLGGHVVAESLAALGADAVFGVPGIHALAIWEALRGGPLRTLASARSSPPASPPTATPARAAGPRRCCSPPARAP